MAGARTGKGAVIGIILIICAVIWILTRIFQTQSAGISGAADADRTEFIGSFGWEVGDVPVKIEEIRIPVEFDEAYEQYNALQLEQGFDLRPYRAYYAKKYTYEIKNYDGSDPIVPIYANLIVIDGVIVGADISSAEAGGMVTVLVAEG